MTYEEFCDDMTARGLPIREHDRRGKFDARAFKDKFGISGEAWDQTPDASQ